MFYNATGTFLCTIYILVFFIFEKFFFFFTENLRKSDDPTCIFIVRLCFVLKDKLLNC